MIKLLSLLFLFLPSNAFAVRAIMEGLPATSNTIIVDTANVRVGIGVASPSTALQVSGVVTATSYAGSGANLTGIPTVAQLTSTATALLQLTEQVTLSTAAIYVALGSTASALTSETTRAIARENEIGVSTGVIQASLDQVIASTEALKDYANWNTAYGWGDHSAAGYADATEVAASTQAIIASTAPLKDYANWNTAFSWGDHSTAGYASQADLSSTATALSGHEALTTSAHGGIASSAQLSSTATALSEHEALTTSAHGGIVTLSVLTATATALTNLTYETAQSTAAIITSTGTLVKKSGDTMTGPLVIQKNAFPLLTLDNAAGGYYSYLDGAAWNTYGPVALSLNTNSPYNDVTVGRRLNVSSAVASVGFYGPGIGLINVPSNAIDGSTYTYRIDGLAAALSTVAFTNVTNTFTQAQNLQGDVVFGTDGTKSTFTATGGDWNIYGKVGIGIGHDASHQLDVSGGAHITGQAIIGGSVTVTGAGGLLVTGNVTANTVTSTATHATTAGYAASAASASAVPASGVQAGALGASVIVSSISAGTHPISVSGNAATVTTNANLTGPVTSVGNATTIAGPVPVSKIDLSTVTSYVDGRFVGVAYSTGVIPSSATGSYAIQVSSLAASTGYADWNRYTGWVSTTAVNWNLAYNTVSTTSANWNKYTGWVSTSAARWNYSYIPSSATGSYGILVSSIAAGTHPISITGNAATVTTNANLTGPVTSVGNATTIAGPVPVSKIDLSTFQFVADGVSLNLSGTTFSAKASSVTLLGNSFNGANQLVQLDGTGKLPAIDGSQLTNLPSTEGGAVLASTQSFTGGNTFVSASTFTGTVNLPTRDKIVFSNQLLNSTFTATMTETSYASAAWGPCITGSTLTITTNGGPIMMSGFINWAITGATYHGCFGYYMDSTFQAAINCVYEPGANGIQSWTLNYPLTGIAAGTHTFCLTVFGQSGATFYAPVASAHVDNSTYVTTTNKWGLWELR